MVQPLGRTTGPWEGPARPRSGRSTRRPCRTHANTLYVGLSRDEPSRGATSVEQGLAAGGVGEQQGQCADGVPQQHRQRVAAEPAARREGHAAQGQAEDVVADQRVVVSMPRAWAARASASQKPGQEHGGDGPAGDERGERLGAPHAQSPRLERGAGCSSTRWPSRRPRTSCPR